MRIIVPFSPGGSADIYARFIGQRLQDALGQAFVVDNRPGAGSIIGTDAVAKSAADGYTLLMMSNTHTVNESLIPTKPYQLMREFVPVAPINYSDLVLVVHPSVPAGNLRAGLGRVRTGIAVRRGDDLPDISDRAALDRSLRAATEIFVPDPQRATAGIHFVRVLEQLGLHHEIEPRLRAYPNGAAAMRALAHSTSPAPVGCTQISEIK